MRLVIEKISFEPDLNKTNNNILLVGMPGIALVGKLTVKTIINHYKAEKVLNLYLDDVPPRIIIDKEGVPTPLSMSLYYAEDQTNKQGLFLLVGDIQPQSHTGQYAFADWVCQLAKKYRIGLIISCAAAINPLFKENPGVHIAGNSFEVTKSFLKHKNVIPFKTGTITGSNGLIPAMAGQKYNIPGGCLLADTTRVTEQIYSTDPLAVKALIRVLNEHLQLHVDTTNLDQQIAELHRTLSDFKQTPTSEKDDLIDRSQTFIS